MSLDAEIAGVVPLDSNAADSGGPRICLSVNCVKLLDGEGRIVSVDDDGLRLMEIDDPASVIGVYWPMLWPEDRRSQVEAGLATARARGVANFIAPCPTAKGTPKWWDVTIATVPGAEMRFIGVSRDITDERAREIEEKLASAALRKLVAGEFAHRVNNILAVVSGVFEQTLLRSADKPALAEAFGGRLKAMARANSAILAHDGEGASIRKMVETQLEPYFGTGKLAATGPDRMLPAAIAQPFALALNELATNALKYGALSSGAGRVTLDWTIDDGGALAIDWRETGGPACVQPVRLGLGSKLIEGGIPCATVQRIFAPEGFRCTIRIPLGAQ